MKTAREEHKENCRNNAVSLEKAWNCIQKKNASRSAKPGQAHIPASPCPADTLGHNTPDSRHPGAIDSEVINAIFEKCRMCADDEGFDLCTYALCPLYKFKLWPGRHENKDIIEVRKHKLSEAME